MSKRKHSCSSAEILISSLRRILMEEGFYHIVPKSIPRGLKTVRLLEQNNRISREDSLELQEQFTCIALEVIKHSPLSSKFSRMIDLDRIC